MKVLTKIMDKKYACKYFNGNYKNYDVYLKLQAKSTELSEMMLKVKEDCCRMVRDKLNDPHTSAKSYWPILKTLYNGKKIPLIPRILINGKLISNFKEKANHFNAFLASQCTPVSNDITLPLVITSAASASLSSVSFRDQDFRNNWKKLNVVPIHEKGDKQLLCKTIGQFLSCQYVVKVLRELFSTQFLNFCIKMVFSVQINQGFVYSTHVKTSYYQTFMKSMLIMINIQFLK